MGPEEEPVDSLIADLLTWAASARAAEGASSRSQVRSLVDQAAADSTWAGLMVDLAEMAAPVILATTGHQWTGRLVGAGRDFVVLERTGAGPVLVSLGAVTRVSRSGAGRPGGDRSPALDLGLAGAIEALASERVPVTVWCGATPSKGQLTGLGRDYLALLPDGGRPDPVFIPLVAVDALELR